MLSSEQVQGLRAPFPAEALSADTSRGFELTSIKAAYVVERLNEVFGLCGVGWRYVHTPFEEVTTEKGQVEGRHRGRTAVPSPGRRHPSGQLGLQRLAIPDRCSAGTGLSPSSPVAVTPWAGVVHPNTDARKSAVTDGLTKAASMLGIGHQVFKGQVRVGAQIHPRNMPTGGNGRQAKSKGGNGKLGATAFWELYHQEAKGAGVPMDVAKGLAGNGDWAAACNQLRTLISAA